MTWNYRVIRTSHDSGHCYHIAQCHYAIGAEPDTVPHSWSVSPVPAMGWDREELFQDLKMMARAFAHPILEEHNGKLREVRE